MNITGNTILITGGSAGIGRGLAEALHALGNQVIIAGRRKETLDETTTANPGMKSLILDDEDANAISTFAARITTDYPALNVLINNAGIMRVENLLARPDDLADMEATITTNLLGPIRLTAALLPHLQKQPQATIINVSSGLAFAPLALTPTYSATKAALHSYTQALRFQLRETTTQVIELIPPLVATELTPGQSSNLRAMPLNDYIAESINLLQTQPSATEILVERVKFQRFAADRGEYDTVFNTINNHVPS
ncbi:MAG: SDR family oxidoreductase [Chitinophagaceae bacterium]|nr:SDR family oxidoreductase [Anaerolineae bacterium]